MQPLGHAQLRVVNYVYTARSTRSYNTILFADPDCCTRAYVYILSRSYTAQPLSYTAVLKYVKFHWYPKSMIDIQCLLSLQAALQALKRLENCPFCAQSQKWGWNNGRSKKRRKSGKNGTSKRSTGIQKVRKLSIFRTEAAVKTE